LKRFPFARHRLGIALLLPALAGCVSTPLPDLHVDLPPAWQQPLPARGVPAAMSWWRTFDDPRLDALVEQALATNGDIGQASARLRAARALARTSDADLRPNLHLRTSDPIDPDASASYLVAGFDSIWELGLFGRGHALRRMARADIEEADADLGGARLAVAAEVARQWTLLRLAQQHEALLRGIQQQRRAQERLVEERARLGLASPQQLAKARAAVAQAGIAQADPHAATVAAAQAIAVLVDRAEPDPAWLQPGPVPVLSAPAVTSVPADLLRQRPDIAHAQAAVVGAAGELGVARADRYPDIAIGGSIIRSISEATRINTDTGAIGSIGPLIDIPLFDWGLRRSREQAKAAGLQAAALAYRKSVLAAVAEVETALATLDAQRLRAQQAQLALDAVDGVAKAMQRRRALGLASDIDVADARIDRDQAALELADARGNHAIAWVALCKALGGDVVAAVAAPTAAAAAAGKR
jgi:NodT family efflux transporter outer membrane factor (OMF) lipoprotein